MSNKPSFFAELRQRHIVRAAIIYAAAVWALAQGIAQLSPVFGMSERVTLWFVIACAIGFPFWLAFAWYFKFTAHGIERESEALEDDATIRRTGRRLDYWIIGILVIAVVLLLTNELVLQRGKTMREFTAAAITPAAASAIPAKSIAVLPFENLSSDKENNYFVAGMQDLILTKLADIGDLKVIARTSTEKYRSHPDDLKTIGAQLGVATILEGSVQKAGNEVLINVQLIDAQTDSHIWAKSYTRTLDNIFGVEGEVAGRIAESLKAELSPTQSAALAKEPTTNQAAYDAFLRAEYQYQRSELSGAGADVKVAIPLYRQAVARDPDFALAWARLSIAESRLAAAGLAGQDAARLNRQARLDAKHALKLQPELPAAQLAIGYCDFLGRRDYAAALRAFAAVLAQRPNDADALQAQGYVRRDQGRFAAAIVSLTRAVALDPRNFTPTLELGNTYMAATRYRDAETWFRRALALEPASLNAKIGYAYAILYGSGDVPRAVAVLQGETPELKLARAWLLIYQRKFAEAIALVESVPDIPGNDALGYSKTIQLAVLYHLAGNQAKARAFFAKGLSEDRPSLPRPWGSTAQPC